MAWTKTSLTLGTLNAWSYSKYDNEQLSYAVFLVKACIDSICRFYQRMDIMQDPMRYVAAKRIVKLYPYLDVCELVDFEEKLEGAQIIIKRNGQDDSSLRVVDGGSILERLKAYTSSYRPVAPEENKSLEPLLPQRPTLGAQGDWQRTHTMDGQYMGLNWDADRYWQDVKQTHNYDLANHCFVYVGDRPFSEAVDYWSKLPTKEERENISINSVAIDTLGYISAFDDQQPQYI